MKKKSHKKSLFSWNCHFFIVSGTEYSFYDFWRKIQSNISLKSRFCCLTCSGTNNWISYFEVSCLRICVFGWLLIVDDRVDYFFFFFFFLLVFLFSCCCFLVTFAISCSDLRTTALTCLFAQASAKDLTSVRPRLSARARICVCVYVCIYICTVKEK